MGKNKKYTLIIQELVNYKMIFIADENEDPEKLEKIAQDQWLRKGDAIRDFISCDERSYEIMEVNRPSFEDKN